MKEQTGLSNKKWDIAIKGLRKHNLVKVEKTDDGLFVSLVLDSLANDLVNINRGITKL